MPTRETFIRIEAIPGDAGREVQLHGPIAMALMANAERLFAAPPSIEQTEASRTRISREASDAD